MLAGAMPQQMWIDCSTEMRETSLVAKCHITLWAGHFMKQPVQLEQQPRVEPRVHLDLRYADPYQGRRAVGALGALGDDLDERRSHHRSCLRLRDPHPPVRRRRGHTQPRRHCRHGLAALLDRSNQLASLGGLSHRHSLGARAWRSHVWFTQRLRSFSDTGH